MRILPPTGVFLHLGNLIAVMLGFYTGPRPFGPLCSIPNTPTANILAQRIISSSDKHFFISKKIGSSVDDIHEWRLIRVTLSATMSSYPSCLKDGRYAIDFYITHPSNLKFNTINHSFWIQYHCRDDLLGASSSSDTHLIHPSDTSEDRHKLLSFHWFLNLTHSDTYIHGPFDFATVNGRKSRNQICQADWDVLLSRASMFHKPLPSSEVPTYSIHVNPCAHVTFHATCLSRDVCSSLQLEDDNTDTQLYLPLTKGHCENV